MRGIAAWKPPIVPDHLANEACLPNDQIPNGGAAMPFWW
jgi:hypothetical protein